MAPTNPTTSASKCTLKGRECLLFTDNDGNCPSCRKKFPRLIDFVVGAGSAQSSSSPMSTVVDVKIIHPYIFLLPIWFVVGIADLHFKRLYYIRCDFHTAQ